MAPLWVCRVSTWRWGDCYGHVCSGLGMGRPTSLETSARGAGAQLWVRHWGCSCSLCRLSPFSTSGLRKA